MKRKKNILLGMRSSIKAYLEEELEITPRKFEVENFSQNLDKIHENLSNIDLRIQALQAKKQRASSYAV